MTVMTQFVSLCLLDCYHCQCIWLLIYGIDTVMLSQQVHLADLPSKNDHTPETSLPLTKSATTKSDPPLDYSFSPESRTFLCTCCFAQGTLVYKINSSFMDRRWEGGEFFYWLLSCFQTFCWKAIQLKIILLVDIHQQDLLNHSQHKFHYKVHGIWAHSAKAL